MPRYVAFLGSINVGGNRLTMAELRAAFEDEDANGGHDGVLRQIC